MSRASLRGDMSAPGKKPKPDIPSAACHKKAW
jgi:hypothetical protein